MTTVLAPPTLAARPLLSVLDDVLDRLTDQEPEALDPGTAAGRLVVALAGLARARVAELGGDPGVRLGRAPGVVVLRELVAARRLLARAEAARASGGEGEDQE
jgi:hypothetical protein